MRRTTLLGMLLAAATWVSADTDPGRQRLQVYGRLIAANPMASTVMVERIDGALWVYRVDAQAARELATLRAGDEVALTFIYDGPGHDDADVVRDFDVLPTRMRADWPLPFGVMAGMPLRDAGFVRTAVIGRERLDASGVDADLAAPGAPVILDDGTTAPGTVNALGGGGFVGGVSPTGVVPSRTVATGSLIPGLGTPGPVLLEGRNLAATPDNSRIASGLIRAATTADALTGTETTLGRPQAAGNFSPGTSAPNVQDPGTASTVLGGTLARPTAESGFTPGTVAPGVRDTAAGRAGVRTETPATTGSFTPGTVAPGVRDTSRTGTFSSPGRETLTTGVPANLVIPNNPATNTGNTGVIGGTTGTGVAVTGGAPTVPSGGVTAPATGGTGAVPQPSATGHGGVTSSGGVPTTTHGGRTSGTSGTSGSRTGTSSGAGPTGTTSGTSGGATTGTSGSGGNP